MARIFTVLRALARDFGRDQRTLGSVAGNNFFPITALMLGRAGGFLYLLIGLVLLFPLSTDPLRRIPSSRLALWPLERRDRWILRTLSPWVNPVSWLIVALAILMARGVLTLGLWAAMAGLVATVFLLSNISLPTARAVWLRVPNLPGRWNQLVRKNIREMLVSLDFYCALLLCVAGSAVRISSVGLPQEALLALTVLVVLALSSYAQCLFGLDGADGLARYRLLPLRGWEALAAKDVAFLLIAIPLTLPLAPLPGTAAALAALAMGHKPAVRQQRDQVRWRFSSGASLIFGFGQAALIGAAAAGTFYRGVVVLGFCLPVWAWSLAYYGRELDRTSRT